MIVKRLDRTADHSRLTRAIGMARIVTGLLFLGLIATLAGQLAAAGPSIVQEFYVPLPETQAQASLKVLYPGIGATLRSVVSVVVTGDGTIVTYDNWEDGYGLLQTVNLFAAFEACGCDVKIVPCSALKLLIQANSRRGC